MLLLPRSFLSVAREAVGRCLGFHLCTPLLSCPRLFCEGDICAVRALLFAGSHACVYPRVPGAAGGPRCLLCRRINFGLRSSLLLVQVRAQLLPVDARGSTGPWEGPEAAEFDPSVKDSSQLLDTTVEFEVFVDKIAFSRCAARASPVVTSSAVPALVVVCGG